MSLPALVISEDYAGLRNQALGLAEAAGLVPAWRRVAPGVPWRWLPAEWWPGAAWAGLNGAPERSPDLVIGCGGVAAAMGAVLRRRGSRVIHIQHPRMDPRRFDLVIVTVHDRLAGENVIVTRTALHRVTPERLAEEAAIWAPRFAHLPRPLVAVLLGGSNGRFRLDAAAGEALARACAAMMREDRVGLVVTPSRRTDPAVVAAFAARVAPLGAWLWDGAGENPYFGLLACADAVVATEDSVSMISEASATCAPVLVARLPGRSRRIAGFVAELQAIGRVRDFAGRLDLWPVAPIDDTAAAAAELRRRLAL